MNSETYLKKLRSVLLENSSEQQTNEILSDYRDFFQTGLTEGKTEAQLCAEFGPPEQAAQELLGSAEDGSEKSGTRKQRLLCVGLSVLALLVYATFSFISSEIPLSASIFRVPAPRIVPRLFTPEAFRG